MKKIPLTPTRCRHCGKPLSPWAVKLGLDICRECANWAGIANKQKAIQCYEARVKGLQ